MSKVLQIRVNDNLKIAADRVFGSMGLDTSTAVRMFLTAAVETRSLPFEAKARGGAIELSDGFGSYICDYGHVHDYSRLDLGEPGETYGPFETAEEAIRSLDEDEV